MKRYLRVLLMLLATAMHLGAPIAAYASAMPAMLPGDFCSAARGAPEAPSDQGAPRPSGEHHCAHAPCCAGGTIAAAALPSHAALAVSVTLSAVRAPTSRPEALPPAPIAAAQPRGPPVRP
jgi:hypothetical protein